LLRLALTPIIGQATEAWAMLCRHRLDPEVAQHQLTPCLVRDDLELTHDREPPVQTPMAPGDATR